LTGRPRFPKKRRLFSKKGNDFMTMLLVALLVASNPAVATEQQVQAQPAAQVAAPAAAPKKKERMVCRDDPAFTGSRVVKQICKPKSEWEGRTAGQASDGASN